MIVSRLLAAGYVVYVLVFSELLTPARAHLWRVPRAGQWLGKLMSCPYCASFWAGLFVVVVPLSGRWGRRFVDACALAGGVSCAHLLYAALKERLR